jgi:hypothetical protein
VSFKDAQSLFQPHARSGWSSPSICKVAVQLIRDNPSVANIRTTDSITDGKRNQRGNKRRARIDGEGGGGGAAAWKSVDRFNLRSCNAHLRASVAPGREGNGAGTRAVMKPAVLLKRLGYWAWSADRSDQSEAKTRVWLPAKVVA